MSSVTINLVCDVKGTFKQTSEKMKQLRSNVKLEYI